MGAFEFLAAAQVSGGGYLSIAKIIPPLIMLLLWARMLTWADKDAPAAHLPREGLNIGFVCGLALAFALFFSVPYYLAALGIVVFVFAAEVGTYLIMRQQKVGLHDLKGQFQNWLASFTKKKKVDAAAGQVALYTPKGDMVPPPEGEDPQRPAYDATQLALTDPLKKGTEQIDLDGRGEGGLVVRYTVDGVQYNGATVERFAGASAIGYLKEIAGLDVEDRRKPQNGTFRLTMDGQKHEARVQTAGTTAGEYMRLMIDPKKRQEFQLDQLGFNDKQLPIIKKSISENKGVVLLSAPKAMGLTSLLYGMLRGHDAFLQHIQTIERDPDQDLDGVTQNRLSATATTAEEFKSVDWVISQEPDVIMINKIEDPRSAVELIKFAKTGKRVYVGLRAMSTFEALAQWRKLIGDDALAVEQLQMVINARVLRKLCNVCKVAYAPDPPTLRKLGMQPEKVTELFQARTTPVRDQKGNPVPCEFCHDLRFKGRTGVFEIMVIGDEIREAIAAGKPVEPVFRQQRGRFLQEEALALVEKGVTSVQEVKRVLRAETSEAPAETPAPAAPSSRRAPRTAVPKG